MKEILKPYDYQRKQKRLVLGGVGGVGKTQLALAFAERHDLDYDSIIWCNAASEPTLRESFRSVAALAFDFQELGDLEVNDVVNHVHRWLSHTENRRWLLIFDNHDDPDQFAIKNYFPPVSHGAIVITTRLPDLVPGRIVRIQPLQDIEESLEILQGRSGRENVKSGMGSANAIILTH